MADLVHNIAKGRMAEWHHRVDNSDPTNAALIVSIWNNDGSSTDDEVRGAITVAAIEALAGVTERTANGWERRTLTDADVSAITIDHTNDRVDLDIPDQTYTAVVTDAATDAEISYDSDTTAGADTDILPGTWHDFVIAPDGSDVTMQVNSAGYFRAA
jgi:hypothetical protein